MTRKSKTRRPVALIGYALKLPGARDRASFWRLLSEGRCAVSQIPADRFPSEMFYHPRAGGDVPGRSYTFAAGVIDDVWDFDPGVFGISPREASQIDPQQRHLLEVTYEALEHAGLRPSRLAGSGTGVYVGASSSDHATRFMFDPSAVDVHMMTGNTLSLISNRLSYAFDLRGPSFTVDTACSSSLVAMHQALQAIEDGAIDTAIVGGVNMLLSPFSFIGFSRASMLSPSGLCKAFDASGDGYVRAEGAVAIVLRAEDVARRNGDRIHAVVVGSGINQDGRTAGLSLPSSDAQAALLAQVYDECGVSPDDLAFVEAHGTGTRVGDPAEAQALGKVLGQRRSDKLPIGSVKTNIGHLEPASGLAGIVKSVMALEHEMLPASLHFNTPNPDIAFDELNVEVAAKMLPLPRKSGPRYAGVNSFGFGGANAHVVLREPDRDESVFAELRAQAPLILSAHDAGALKALSARYAETISERADAAAIANAAAHHRDLLSERAVVAGEEPVASLSAHAAGRPAPSLWSGSAVGTDLPCAFVFSGNGSQWAGMGLRAYAANLAFRDALHRFDERFEPIAGWSAIEKLQSRELAADIRHASYAQPLLLAIQIAAVEALQAHGLEPDLAFGHSVGEIGAAWCAGALDLDNAIGVVLARSQRQEITRHRGSMAAVLVSQKEMAALLDRGAFPGLEIAAINSARSVTVAGPRTVIEDFVHYAEQERWGVRKLDLDYPFHCALVDPIEHQLVSDLEGLAPRPARIPFLSTVTGVEIAGDELGPDYWWRNVRQPVDFHAAMDEACQRGIRVFIEIGPHAVLGSYMNDALRKNDLPGAVIPTLSREADPESDEIVAASARALIAGARIDLDRLVGPKVVPATDLPNYAWQRKRYALSASGEALRTFSSSPHPFLGNVTRGDTATWFAAVDPGLLPWLDDHRVEGAAVFPAAGFIEVALAAARETFGNVPLEVRDLEILQPLVFDGVRSFEVTTRLAPETHTLEMRSRPRPGEDEAQLNAKAIIAKAPSGADIPDRAIGEIGERFDSDGLYRIAKRRGFAYGEAFRRIASVEVGENRSARVEFSRSQIAGSYVLDPTLLDSAFHVLFALTEHDKNVPADALLLPVRAGSLRVYHASADVAQGIARITSSTPRSQVADFTLLDAEGRVVAELRQARCRVVTRAVSETQDQLVYRTDFVRLAHASSVSALSDLHPQGPAHELAEAARSITAADDTGDVALVLDAGARSAAYSALQSLMAGDEQIVLAELASQDRLALSSWPLATQMLLALSDAGLAQETEQGWKLAQTQDLPMVGDLVDLLLTRYPTFVAEATALARLADHLPVMLRDGLERAAAPSLALLDHLTRGSPQATRLAKIVARTAADIVRHWPRREPLRVLVVGTANLPLAVEIAPAVSELHGVVVATDIDAQRLDSAPLDPFDTESRRLRMTAWEQAVDPAAGGYDLILCAGELHRIANVPGRLDVLLRSLLRGGALIAAEPSPSLFADLAFGQTPGWWARSINPDFPTGAILSQEDWQALLAEQGLEKAFVQAIGSSILIGAVSAGAADSAGQDSASRNLVVIADNTQDSRMFAELLKPRLEQGGRVVPFISGEAMPKPARRVQVFDLPNVGRPSQWLAGSSTDLIFVAAKRKAPDDPVATLSRQIQAVTGFARALSEGARLWVICTGALGGVADDQAPDASQHALWNAMRVLQNEYPDVEIRCLDHDPALALDAGASRLASVILHPGRERELRIDNSGQSCLRIVRGGVLPLANRVDDEAATLRLAFGRSGMFENFGWEPSARRAPKGDEVEIEIAATGLNFRDVMWSLGLLPDEALENGFTGPSIGMECSGVVSAVGRDVKRLSVGDRVLAFAADAFATHAVVGERMVARIPAEISTEAAATLPVAFLTAYYALVHLARLQPGETVLIHGGAGGVGLAALQIAKQAGARVIATAGSPDRRALLKSLGVEHIFDSRSLAFADDVRRATQGAGVDVVLNSLAGEAMLRSIDCLKPFGRFLELGKRDFYANSHIGLRPFRNNLSYFGIDADQLLTAHAPLIESLFAELMAKFASGELVPLPYRVFEASDVSAAFQLMKRSGHVGKILVRPPRARPRQRTAGTFSIDPRARYLITGGLSGFGLATARWLAAKGARHLTLMSRTGRQTDDNAAILAELKARGVQVDLVAADVSNRAELDRYLTSLDGGEYPLKGVFHAAMVLDDAFAADLDAERIESVLRPKVMGAVHLDELTRRFDLDCFVMFSSVAAMVGNVGQASYVAANAFLDGLARRRRAEGLPALSVGFGAIGDAGYLTRNQAVSQALAQRLGRSALVAEEALEGMAALLRADPRDASLAAVAFARLDWSMARKELVTVRSALFDELHLDETKAEGATLANAELLRKLREMPDAEVQQTLADLIAESITRTLRLPSGEVDRARALSEFGMDSLMMLELRMAVEEKVGIEIPLMSLTSSLTVTEMSKRLTAMLRNHDKATLSGQMSVLAQEHVEIPESVSDAEVAATAAAVARRAQGVNRIL